MNRTLRALLSLSCPTLAVACVAASDEPTRGERTGSVELAIKAPLAAAYCNVNVLGKGVKAMEEDYLPRVVTCENGGASLEALKAQAIAARSVAYYEMASYGDICDGQGCQVYTCANPPTALAKQAVAETSGLYLSYGAMLTYGFYVDGDPKTAPPACLGSSAYKNEKWVTYNEGKTGKTVEQTPLGFIGPPGFGQNRGCMSQWGARCLEKTGEDYLGILRFYYGEDIQILQAPGPCVKPLDADGDGLSDAVDNCPDATNASQVDLDDDGEGDACDLDDDGDGIADEKDDCPKVANPDQADADADGLGDACDTEEPTVSDTDGDGVEDGSDLCPELSDPDQADADADGLGDACDTDDDEDGVGDADDTCPKVPNPDQDPSACKGTLAIEGGATVRTSCALERGRTDDRWLAASIAVGLALVRRRKGGPARGGRS